MTTSALVATALVAGARFSERLPGPTYESPTEGSPGFAGFVATFALALAIIVLGVSFTRRIRRADHRERQRAAAETQAADADGAGTGPGAGDGPVAEPTRSADRSPGQDVADRSAEGGADEPPVTGERA